MYVLNHVPKKNEKGHNHLFVFDILLDSICSTIHETLISNQSPNECRQCRTFPLGFFLVIFFYQHW